MKLRLESFRCALAGVTQLLKTQAHARWHLVATCLVTVLGFVCEIQRGEWLALLLAMALVWTAEAFNTAMEIACDAITREQHPLIGQAKDMAAGAVLLAAIFACLVGAIVFTPRIFDF